MHSILLSVCNCMHEPIHILQYAISYKIGDITYIFILTYQVPFMMILVDGNDRQF